MAVDCRGETKSSQGGGASLDVVTNAANRRAFQSETSAHDELRSGRCAPWLAQLGTTDASLSLCLIPVLASPPSCLPSLGSGLLSAPVGAMACTVGTMKALTPAAGHTTAGLPTSVHVPSSRSIPNHTVRPVAALAATAARPITSRLRPWTSRLAATPRRIGFVLLRTASSPPVAPHPASRRRSYLRLRGCGSPRSGLTPP